VTRVLVAVDSFKGSLTAAEAGAAVAAGVRRADPGAAVSVLPVSDGGEGFLALAVAHGYAAVPVTVSGPTGEPVETSYAVRRATTGTEVVVEMADACGLLRLPGGVRAPMTASSRGLGEVLAAALVRERPDRVLVGIGGSASTDGGAGMVGALGVHPVDATGRLLPDGGGPLTDVAGLARDDDRPLPSRTDNGPAPARSGTGHPAAGDEPPDLLARLRATDLRVACDVSAPLTGPAGAAYVFGPQKGASPEQVAALDAALTRWADVVTAATGRDVRHAPGTGAAGGVGYAALALLGARLLPGVEVALDLVGFDTALDGVDLVITGEGSLDAQSLLGKAPLGVARRARARGIPVVAVCGRTTLTEEERDRAGFADVWALSDLEPDPARSMARAAILLQHLVSERLGGRQ